MFSHVIQQPQACLLLSLLTHCCQRGWGYGVVTAHPIGAVKWHSAVQHPADHSWEQAGPWTAAGAQEERAEVIAVAWRDSEAVGVTGSERMQIVY